MLTKKQKYLMDNQKEDPIFRYISPKTGEYVYGLQRLIPHGVLYITQSLKPLEGTLNLRYDKRDVIFIHVYGETAEAQRVYIYNEE